MSRIAMTASAAVHIAWVLLVAVCGCGKEAGLNSDAGVGDTAIASDVADPWGPSCVGEPRPDLPCPDELRGTKCVRAACPANYYRLECVVDGVGSTWKGTTEPSLCGSAVDSGLEVGPDGCALHPVDISGYPCVTPGKECRYNWCPTWVQVLYCAPSPSTGKLVWLGKSDKCP